MNTVLVPRKVSKKRLLRRTLRKLCYGRTTTKEIAAELASKGMKGIRGRPNGCALSLYAQKAINDPSVLMGVNTAGTFYFGVPLPKLLIQFLQDADAGSFPELEVEDVGKK